MKFRTTIKHKAGSSIEINGCVIALNPDDDGFCEFDVPEGRDDVFARLVEIPEGFEQIDASAVVTNGDDTVDLSALDKAGLSAFAESIGMDKFHPNTGEARMRTEILRFLSHG